MYTNDPQNDGELLYESKPGPTPWLLTTAVGVGIGVLFAVPGIALLMRSYEHGWSIGILGLAVCFGILSAASIVTTVNLAFKARSNGVTLSDRRLTYNTDRSREFIDCNDIVGAKRESDGVWVKTKSGSLYLPEQYIGSENEATKFVDCVDTMIRARNRQPNSAVVS